jgi:hypothetical protein
VEYAITRSISQVRAILAAPTFLNAMSDHGVKTAPKILAHCERPDTAKSYGAALLEFAVVWAFVAKLMACPKLANSFGMTEFLTDLKMTYLSILTEGPLARLPYARVFGAAG